MKRFIVVGGLSFAAATLGITSCDWSGGSDGAFNSSRGGMDINISGNYRGILSGGKAVSNTTGGAITSFVVQQSGNVLQVTDSNAQEYRGNVGSPLAIAELPAATAGNDTPVLPAGAQLANFSVSWSGKDGVAAKDIRFTGVINVVSVQDVNGTTKTDTNGNTKTDSNGNTTTITNNQGGNGTVTKNSNTTSTTTTGSGTSGSQIVNEGVEGFFSTNQTVTVVNNVNNNTSTSETANNNSNTSSSNNTNTSGTTTTTTNTFQLTDANTQFRLRGTWIENGGVTASVDALSAGAGGVLVLLNFGVGGATPAAQ